MTRSYKDGRRCTATSKRTGLQCANPPESDCNVCRFHGARAAQTVAKRAERRAEREALAVLENLSEPLAPITNPVAELASLGAEILFFKDVFRDEVARLRKLESFDKHGAEEIRAVVRVYERALDRSTRVLAEMARLDIEDRMVKVEAAQSRLWFAAVMAGLDVVGLTRAQLLIAREAIAAEVRKVVA